MPTMRAVRYDRYGPPEVLQIRDVPTPQVGAGDVLVQVHAASVSGGEMMIRAGKLRRMVRQPLPTGVGTDFAGRVAAVGGSVQGLRVGDRVWGLLPHLTFGSTADYVAVPEKLLSLAPTNINLVEAAALPAVGTTVVTALTEKVQLQAGQRLLVRGAAGGVGSVAVQLGKALGAHVTALASARDLEWVRELGAEVAHDYRTVDLDAVEPFDVVLDAVGTDLASFRRLLTRQGHLIALAVDPDHLLRSFAYVAVGGAARSRRVVSFSNNPTAEQLARLTRYVESGAIRPLVDRTFGLDAVAEAHTRMEAGGVRGKYVITTGNADAPDH